MAKQTTQKANAEQLRVNEKKWTKPLMDAGWSVLPNIIIEKQAALGLHPLDMNIILHLVQYWWVADNLPHPSVATIAEAIGGERAKGPLSPGSAYRDKLPTREGVGSFIRKYRRRRLQVSSCRSARVAFKLLCAKWLKVGRTVRPGLYGNQLSSGAIKLAHQHL